MSIPGNTFAVNDTVLFRTKMLNWASRFNIFCFLDHQPHQDGGFDVLAGVGCRGDIRAMAGNALVQLQEWRASNGGWCFGHLAYDLKNETASLASGHFDGIGFPDLYFFIPETVVLLQGNTATIYSETPLFVWELIMASPEHTISSPVPSGWDIRSRFTRDEYLAVVAKLRRHILRGDCYEINFCQEFYATGAMPDPVAVYRKLIQVSPNPFSALYRLEDRYCICASPERFLQKTDNRLLSQPIKGTAKRFPYDEAADLASRNQLRESRKEQSENVMVVDLVRNDLSKICGEGSVQVDELFGIYPFPQVYQMISTVSGQLEADKTLSDILRATFPMGSMTGAPKQRVMQLIEQYELTRRGLFSGSIGYMDPDGNFDFNVVIRSILYNATAQYLSFQTGSAITFYSDGAQEYEECLLKAKAIMTVLQ